jgi:hypothetical protein
VGGARRPPVQIHVTVSLATLLGLADDPGQLVGHGPIPADLARRLAADASWRRLVTDPLTGQLLDYGRRTYTPPAPLAAFLRARDGHCVFPGCAQPAHRCDIDHTVPYDASGATDRANCGLLCRRHHRLKHETGWHLERRPDATVVWTSPSGARYRLPPPKIPPDG